MKRVFYYLVFLPLISFSQIQYDANNFLFFEQVYEIDLSKDEIRSNVNEWIAQNFKDANNVIKMNSDDKIIAKGVFSQPGMSDGFTSTFPVHFDLITDFKEGRYKVLLENIEIKDVPIFQNLNLKNEFMTIDEYHLMILDIAEKQGTANQAKRLMEKGKYNKLYEESKEKYFNTLKETERRLTKMASNIAETVNDKSKTSEW